MQSQNWPACVAELLPSAAVTQSFFLLPDKTLSVAIEGSVEEAKALFKPHEESQGNVLARILPQVFCSASGDTESPPGGSAGPLASAVLDLFKELDFMFMGRQGKPCLWISALHSPAHWFREAL